MPASIDRPRAAVHDGPATVRIDSGPVRPGRRPATPTRPTERDILGPRHAFILWLAALEALDLPAARRARRELLRLGISVRFDPRAKRGRS